MEATASSPTAPKVNLRAVVPLALLFLGSVAAIFSPAGAGSTGGHAPDTGDTAWMLTASALVLLMTPGLSFFYGGMVRPKNIISTMLQSFIAMGVVSLLWVVVGFSLAFGRSLGGIVGDPRTFFMFQGVRELTDPDLSPTVPLLLFALFQLKFAIITPALVSGSFAERVRFSAYLLFIALFTVVVYCPLAHATWHPQGLLHRYGLLDFAGGTVVHMSAGIAALAGARFLGKRVDYEPGQPHPPAHVPYVLLGTGMLWFGWFGFNAGSALTASPTAAHAFLTTNTASAAAMLAWMLLERVRGLRPSALGACIGAVVGLVAITPAAGFVAVGPSIFIGVTAAVVSTYAVHLKTRSTLDDTLDVFPCHGVGGIVGMLLTGVFADQRVNSAGTNGLFQGNPELFWKHLLAVPALCVLVFCAAWMLYKLTDLVVPLRVSPEHETQGLDLSQHGESASLPREQH
jgi:Amt family ammonium transporter